MKYFYKLLYLSLVLLNANFCWAIDDKAEKILPYPSKTVRIVVGFSPGGPTDRVARELAAKLQSSWKQSVVVENKPGAGGRIAFETVASAAPDGYTLLVSGVQAATNMVAYKEPGFDTLRDFEPISQLTSTALILAVNPQTPVKTVSEFIEWAKTQNAPLTFSTSGVASSPHFAGELFSQLTGVAATHIPYSGAAGAQTALLSGHVDMAFVSPLSALALVREGKLRGLAVTGTTRFASLADLPTMQEAGVKGFEVNSWQALLAPARTPPQVVAAIYAGVVEAWKSPDVRARLNDVAAEPVASSPDVFRKYLKREIKNWSRVAHQARMIVE
jgi:tripartite-type tricarboxylate transporter receptor subunit TctC